MSSASQKRRSDGQWRHQHYRLDVVRESCVALYSPGIWSSATLNTQSTRLHSSSEAFWRGCEKKADSSPAEQTEHAPAFAAAAAGGAGCGCVEQTAGHCVNSSLVIWSDAPSPRMTPSSPADTKNTFKLTLSLKMNCVQTFGTTAQTHFVFLFETYEILNTWIWSKVK